ncbi:MAG: CsbD family protein [Azovibrio sp.]|uniref:CsbD family protein n=1 Tax=Azovibrio sp. TaxID=1872673 RepID=UPI003C76F548
MNKDQVKGHLKEATGKVKEVAGKLVGNDELELKGKIEKTGGKAQATYGNLKEDPESMSSPQKTILTH